MKLRVLIQLFAKFPCSGLAKTRLIPALGAEGAAAWQNAAILLAVDRLRRFRESSGAEIEVWFTGADLEAMRLLIGDGIALHEQPSGDLGQRLTQAADSAFARGFERLLIMGTDAPGLDALQWQAAIKALDSHDVVLGPAEDGGYYLIGLRASCPAMFQEIDWGTDQVFAQSRRQAKATSLRLAQLETLPDVDHPDDLRHCRGISNDWDRLLGDRVAGRVSVIIPAMNEAANLLSTLRSTRGTDPDKNIEVIVVDGGSSDETRSIAETWGARVIGSRPGRARQMNAGGAIARGEWLVFLHADSQLPESFEQAIRESGEKGFVGGAFRLAIDDPRPLLRMIAWGTNLRSRFWGRPYGDQALFVKAETFDRLRGYVDWPLMEDYDFAGRLRRSGPTTLLNQYVLTSARRWQKRGPLRVTLLNQLIVAAFHCGVSVPTLAQWYRGTRSAEKR